MALIDGPKELAIRAAVLATFSSLTDVFIFSRPREIESSQEFVATTTKIILGNPEVRYLEFWFEGFADVQDESQLDDDCVPVHVNYRGQIGFAHVEGLRSDDSNSHDTVAAFILDFRNRIVNNGTLIVGGKSHELSRLTQLIPMRIDRHPLTKQDTHLWDFSFHVEVRE